MLKTATANAMPRRRDVGMYDIESLSLSNFLIYRVRFKLASPTHFIAALQHGFSLRRGVTFVSG
jgi:hypothetical protein